jgi:pentatricopeptide repeat protein
LGNVGRIDDAMELFEEMKREGIERDTVTYNTLITGLGSVGRIDDAMELFEEMKR